MWRGLSPRPSQAMLTFYVEGDGGHLLDEQLGQPRFRYLVRGSCVSYMMPWEDVMAELKAAKIAMSSTTARNAKTNLCQIMTIRCA